MVDGAKPRLRRGQIGKRIVEIGDAFKALTKELGFRPLDLERVGRGTVEMGPRELRLATIYFAWASRYQRRFLMCPHVVVEWIEDERRLDVGALPFDPFRTSTSRERSAFPDYSRAAAISGVDVKAQAAER